MPIPAYMTTPYAPRISGRARQPQQAMIDPTRGSALGTGIKSVFSDLRGTSPDVAGYDANGNAYGTTGGLIPQQASDMMSRQPAAMSEGLSQDPLAVALEQMGQVGRAAASRRGAAGPDVMAEAAPGAALAVEGARRGYDIGRASRMNVDPYMVSPGLAPEEAASRLGALDIMALRANGVAPARDSGRPVYSMMDARGRPVLTETGPGENPYMLQDSKPSAYDRNRQAVSNLATNALDVMRQAGQPQFYEDPVSGERKAIFGHEMQPSGVNPRKATAKVNAQTGVEKVAIGPQTYYYHHASKTYFDEDGNPVNLKEDPAIRAARQAPSDQKPKDGTATPASDESGTRDETAAEMVAELKAMGTKPLGGPAVTHNHNDVWAEMKKRGITK